MMSEDKVKVGDRFFPWEIKEDKYNECEFKKVGGPILNLLEITKVPDPKPEIPDEPRTRGDVVTIEGDDEFIAVLFSEYMPYPFLYTNIETGDNARDHLASWDDIVSLAAGRKIIIHKMVGLNEAPVKVNTYYEWLELSEEGLKKYKWRDDEGDLWWYSSSHDSFLPEGEPSDFAFDIKHYFPLIRDEKIG